MCIKLETATLSCILSSTFLLRSGTLVRPFMHAHILNFRIKTHCIKTSKSASFHPHLKNRSCILVPSLRQKITPCTNNLHHNMWQKSKNTCHSYKTSLHFSQDINMATYVSVGLFHFCANLYQNPAHWGLEELCGQG